MQQVRREALSHDQEPLPHLQSVLTMNGTSSCQRRCPVSPIRKSLAEGSEHSPNEEMKTLRSLPVYLIHWDALQWCLSASRSVLQSVGLAFSLTIVNNGPTVSAKYWADNGVNARVITLATNRGFSGGANTVLLRAKREGIGGAILGLVRLLNWTCRAAGGSVAPWRTADRRRASRALDAGTEVGPSSATVPAKGSS